MACKEIKILSETHIILYVIKHTILCTHWQSHFHLIKFCDPKTPMITRDSNDDNGILWTALNSLIKSSFDASNEILNRLTAIRHAIIIYQKYPFYRRTRTEFCVFLGHKSSHHTSTAAASTANSSKKMKHKNELRFWIHFFTIKIIEEEKLFH